jgi:hypothetical protein
MRTMCTSCAPPKAATTTCPFVRPIHSSYRLVANQTDTLLHNIVGWLGVVMGVGFFGTLGLFMWKSKAENITVKFGTPALLASDSCVISLIAWSLLIRSGQARVMTQAMTITGLVGLAAYTAFGGSTSSLLPRPSLPLLLAPYAAVLCSLVPCGVCVCAEPSTEELQRRRADY